MRLGRLTPASTSILPRFKKRQREIARRAAEHVGDDDDAAAEIDGLGGRSDLALAALDVVLGADADGAQMRLRSDHVLHRRDEFLREAAMGDENDADHVGCAAECGANDSKVAARWKALNRA